MNAIEVVKVTESGFEFINSTEFGNTLRMLPVNSMFESIQAKILQMIECNIKLTKKNILSELSKEEKSFINRWSR